MPAGKWEPFEIDYLLNNANDKTDAEMAAYLGRTRLSVIQKRRKLKLVKQKSKITESEISAMMRQTATFRETNPVAELDAAQKRHFWLKELESSANWKECLKMFDDEELKLYREKYIETIMVLENVNEIEKGSIHIMISSLIRMNRYQKLEKDLKQMANPDGDTVNRIVTLHREIKDTVEIYLKSQEDLNASRKQRIKDEGDQRVNLLELLKELESKENRDKMGREADALKKIQEMESVRLRNEGYITDGSNGVSNVE